MIIQQTYQPSNRQRLLKNSLTLGSLVIFSFLLVVTLLGYQQQKPTGTYLSPLPQGELASQTFTPTPEVTKADIEYINLAQNYLQKSYTLAKTQNQTTSDKQAIISALHQSLEYINQAIKQNPQNPQSYLVRAQIMTSIATINPEATVIAQRDLETAQKLSQGQTVELPPTVDPLSLIPEQQASAPSNLIVAAPEDEKANNSQVDTDTNSLKSTVMFRAGQTQLLIKNTNVTGNSYIYLIPQQKTNQPIQIISKSSGQFTLGVNSALPQDIAIDYWIINP